MTAAQTLARIAVLQAAILRELHEADDDTRHALREAMGKGDRVTVWDGDRAIGAVSIPKPRKVTAVQDWPAFIRWVEAHAPAQIITTTQISPGFISRLKRDGEWVDPATGEVVTPDGLGTTEGTITLRVEVTDAGRELGRTLLNQLPELPRGESSLTVDPAEREDPWR